MSHTIDETEKHYKEIVLFPDYASSGIWCTCGLSIADPLNELPIPYQFVELVDMWNQFWDFASSYPDFIDIETTERRIISAGRILSNIISEYIPCSLVEENCKLNIRK